MIRIPTQVLPGLHGLPEGALALALLAVSLVLIFAGKSVVKVLAFVAVGLVGASVGGTIGFQYLGAGGDFVGIVLGFVLGGLLGVMLVALGVGLLIGYAAYLLTLGFIPIFTAAFIVGVVFFAVGALMSSEILAVVTALAGGALLFDVLRGYSLGLAISGLIAVLVTVAGIWVQMSSERRVVKPTAVQTRGSAE